jgi:hypothetical protein
MFFFFFCNFNVLNSGREYRRFWTEWWEALHEFNLLLISSCIRFCLLLSFSNIWTVPHFQNIS